MNGTNPTKIGNGGRALVRMAAALAAAVVLLGGGAATAAPTSQAPAATTAPAPAGDAGRVDVNSASAAELASLPGIGDSKAAAIIAEREKKPFASVEDLERVRGIGARTVEDLRGKVTVGSR